MSRSDKAITKKRRLGELEKPLRSRKTKVAIVIPIHKNLGMKEAPVKPIKISIKPLKDSIKPKKSNLKAPKQPAKGF
jgi:hypothetical protein